jgi:putative oxidoreductase
MFTQHAALNRWVPLILQVFLGLIFMAHGAQKLFGAFGGPGMTGFTAFITRIGLTPPVFWAWVVAIVEFFGGLCILLGLFTRVAALLIIADMIGAIVTVNWKIGFFWTKGGLEFPLTLAVIALTLILTGPGFVSLDRVLGIETAES